MGIFSKNEKVTTSKYQLVIDRGDGFFSYNGNVYQSDIIRSCVRVKAQAVGQAVGKHIRQTATNLQVNPDLYIKFLLEEPNPYMTGQMLQEKMITQLMLNNNAFALIIRDPNGLPCAIYPLNASSGVEAVQDNNGNLFLKFSIGAKMYTFAYTDIIHLRRDYNDNLIFGDNPIKALMPLMEIVSTADQGIVKAIKNSNVIKWLLKFNQTLRDDDIERNTKKFVDSFLKIDNDFSGAAAIDAKMDAQQVEPKNYVPDSSQTLGIKERIYSFFNINEKIINSSYTENEWISYYEAEIAPALAQLSGEYTRKLFTRRERSFGNRIIFESSNLSFASIKTKISLVQFVDRGIMSPNEVRTILNYAPREGGDEFIRRLDTALTREDEEGGDEENESGNQGGNNTKRL